MTSFGGTACSEATCLREVLGSEVHMVSPASFSRMVLLWWNSIPILVFLFRWKAQLFSSVSHALVSAGSRRWLVAE